MDTISYLTALTIILVLGIIMGLIARKLRIPNMLLLLMLGIVLSNLDAYVTNVIKLSDSFLISVSILTLVMIVFDGSTKFKLKELDTYSIFALKTTLIVLVLNMLFLSFATSLFFGIRSILLCILFAGVVSGTDPASVLTLFKSRSNKVTDLLKYESIINTPIMVLIPFLVLDIMKLKSDILTSFIDMSTPFIKQIIVAVGTGIFIGIIVFRGMKNFYSEQISPLLLITSALLTYILAENLEGNGVLAVTVLGVAFGNIYVKQKALLQEFSSMLSNSFEILVFIFVGFIISVTFEQVFIIKSFILFLLLLAIRFVALNKVYMHESLNMKEKIFMTMNCSQGLAAAVVAFVLSQNSVFVRVDGSHIILNLIVLFMIYSIIFSTVISRFSKYFINIDIEEN